MFILIDGVLYSHHGWFGPGGFAALKERQSLLREGQVTSSCFGSQLVPAIHSFDLSSLEEGVYRIRRGKLVRIPDEWVGSIPTKQTMRRRQSVSRRTRKENK